jgi:acid stress-induced BolA-like protein IbaG/YrbA
MTPEEIQTMIEAGLADSKATVTGDGSHFEATVICAAFADKAILQQHKMVYATLGNSMESAIHALSIKTFTPEAWAAQQ